MSPDYCPPGWAYSGELTRILAPVFTVFNPLGRNLLVSWVRCTSISWSKEYVVAGMRCVQLRASAELSEALIVLAVDLGEPYQCRPDHRAMLVAAASALLLGGHVLPAEDWVYDRMA